MVFPGIAANREQGWVGESERWCRNAVFNFWKTGWSLGINPSVATVIGAVPLDRNAVYIGVPVVEGVFVERDQFTIFEVTNVGIENEESIVGFDDGRVDGLTWRVPVPGVGLSEKEFTFFDGQRGKESQDQSFFVDRHELVRCAFENFGGRLRVGCLGHDLT